MHFYNTTEDSNNQDEHVLKDVTKSGKERPWRERKIDNVSYAELLQILKFQKAGNVGACGRVLEFKPTDEGYLKLFRTWFCKSKLCPVCNWRRSMKNSYQAQRVVEEVIKEKPKARWLFLTLTARNAVDGIDLKSRLSELTKAFNKLKMYAKVKKNLIGFMRSTEITVNQADGSYNQHIHVLLCVENTYFRDSDNYLSHEDWTNLWQRALQINYRPVIKVQVIKPNRKGDSDIQSAIKETSKYSVKSAEYLTNDEARNLEIVSDLELGLFRKRMISYGGLLKEKHKELNLDDAEDGNLIQTSDEDETSESEEEANSVIAVWHYHRQNYYLRHDG